MSKIDDLIKFLFKNNFQKEAKILSKLAAPIPPNDPEFPVKEMGGGSFNLGGYESGITEQDLLSNLNLKRLFKKYYDPSFIGKFKFYHFFQEGSIDLYNFIEKFSKAKNPREMSVIGTQEDPCSIFQKAPFSRQYALELEGEVTSAFYFDASSSLMSSVSNESLIRKLESLGVNLRDEEGNLAYFPKLTALHRGNLESFFYDEHSYEEASGGRPSDYHEFFIKNSKITKILVRPDYNPEEVYKDFFHEDEIDPDIKPLLEPCGGISVDNFEEDVISNVENFITRSYYGKYRLDLYRYESAYNNATTLEQEDNIDKRLVKGFEERAGELPPRDLILAIKSVIDNNTMEELSNAFFEHYITYLTGYNRIDNPSKITDLVSDLTSDIYDMFKDEKWVSKYSEQAFLLILKKYFKLIISYCSKFKDIMENNPGNLSFEKMADEIVHFLKTIDNAFDDALSILFEKVLKRDVFSKLFEEKQKEIQNIIKVDFFDKIDKNEKLKKEINYLLYEDSVYINKTNIKYYLDRKDKQLPATVPKMRPVFGVLEYNHDEPAIGDFAKNET